MLIVVVVVFLVVVDNAPQSHGHLFALASSISCTARHAPALPDLPALPALAAPPTSLPALAPPPTFTIARHLVVELERKRK